MVDPVQTAIATPHTADTVAFGGGGDPVMDDLITHYVDRMGADRDALTTYLQGVSAQIETLPSYKSAIYEGYREAGDAYKSPNECAVLRPEAQAKYRSLVLELAAVAFTGRRQIIDTSDRDAQFGYHNYSTVLDANSHAHMQKLLASVLDGKAHILLQQQQVGATVAFCTTHIDGFTGPVMVFNLRDREGKDFIDGTASSKDMSIVSHEGRHALDLTGETYTAYLKGKTFEQASFIMESNAYYQEALFIYSDANEEVLAQYVYDHLTADHETETPLYIFQTPQQSSSKPEERKFAARRDFLLETLHKSEIIVPTDIVVKVLTDEDPKVACKRVHDLVDQYNAEIKAGTR